MGKKGKYWLCLVGSGLAGGVAGYFVWKKNANAAPELTRTVIIVALIILIVTLVIAVFHLAGYGYKIKLLRRMKIEHLWYTSDENSKCKRVVISPKAYRSMIHEVDARKPLETGGYLYGQMDDRGRWYVIEATCAKENSILTEEGATLYLDREDDHFSQLYGKPIQLLGMWHSHPNYMNVFSIKDDETNYSFAKEVGNGTLSFIITTFPKNKLTCYYLNKENGDYHLLKFDIED